jgi:hypothetical protein
MTEEKVGTCDANDHEDQENNKCPPTPEASIADEVLLFIKHIDSLEETFPLSMLSIGKAAKKATENLIKFQESYCEEFEEGEIKGYRVKHEHWGQLNRLLRQNERSNLSFNIVPRSFVVSLISQYDAFLGRLLRAIFLIKPETLNASDKNITLSQLLEFDSLSSAKEFVLEKEIESFLRNSHSDQFAWLEKKFSIQLRKGLEIWQDFIEITERRNLFVHTDGIISSQYLNVCCNHGVTLDKKIEIGVQLGVNRKYFRSACECIFEIGVKLAHVLWRKLTPEQREEADEALNAICYELLVDQRYLLAIKLLDFASIDIKKHSNERARRVIIVNRALAYKWHGNQEKAVKIISEEDWSATSVDFQLAEAVLKDDFDRAIKIMKNIGAEGNLGKEEYKEWPLFKEWRKTEEFSSTYKDIFKEPFELVDIEKAAIETLGDKLEEQKDT